MQKSKGSRSRSEIDQEPFTTIDDALATAKKLTAMLTKLGDYKHPLDVRRASRVQHRKEVETVPESIQMKGSGRTHFFDFKETSKGKAYLVITESRKTAEGKFEKHRIFVFPEDANEFSEKVAEATAAIE